MKLIVGLGNPDKKYADTYHNLGFCAVDAFCDKFGFDFSKKKCQAIVAEDYFQNEKIIIAKPQTYMNLSGNSVREFVNKFKIDLKDILIVFDDIDIEKGTTRFRKNGSAGTHNGMRSIVENLKSMDFARLKIGAKPQFKPNNLADYVLSNIGKNDWKDKVMDEACNKIEEFILGKC